MSKKSSACPTKPARSAAATPPAHPDLHTQLGLRPGQSLPLLQELHILTREGRINQDSRRKLKQVNHLLQFIEKVRQELPPREGGLLLADHGAGKSYLGFMLYDLWRTRHEPGRELGHLYGIETRADLVERSRELAARLRRSWNVEYDDAGAVGRRYRRQDEVGTPFCLTYDFDSPEDGAVTVRERDTMTQERIPLEGVERYLAERLIGC